MASSRLRRSSASSRARSASDSNSASSLERICTPEVPFASSTSATASRPSFSKRACSAPLRQESARPCPSAPAVRRSSSPRISSACSAPPDGAELADQILASTGDSSLLHDPSGEVRRIGRGDQDRRPRPRVIRASPADLRQGLGALRPRGEGPHGEGRLEPHAGIRVLGKGEDLPRERPLRVGLASGCRREALHEDDAARPNLRRAIRQGGFHVARPERPSSSSVHSARSRPAGSFPSRSTFRTRSAAPISRRSTRSRCAVSRRQTLGMVRGPRRARPVSAARGAPARARGAPPPRSPGRSRRGPCRSGDRSSSGCARGSTAGARSPRGTCPRCRARRRAPSRSSPAGTSGRSTRGTRSPPRRASRRERGPGRREDVAVDEVRDGLAGEEAPAILLGKRVAR